MDPVERIRVVLIDDNDVTRGVLRLALPFDIEVVGEAASGRSGLDACLRLKPDIVFLDILMPDMGGLEILPAIKDALPMTEVLMVTASNDRLTIEQSIMGGAASFIIKPFSAGTIQDAVNRALNNLKRKRSAQGAAGSGAAR
ncbi:MAG: response regulator transcription factor [Massilia sp.]